MRPASPSPTRHLSGFVSDHRTSSRFLPSIANITVSMSEQQTDLGVEGEAARQPDRTRFPSDPVRLCAFGWIGQHPILLTDVEPSAAEVDFVKQAVRFAQRILLHPAVLAAFVIELERGGLVDVDAGELEEQIRDAFWRKPITIILCAVFPSITFGRNCSSLDGEDIVICVEYTVQAINTSGEPG